jgi:hypothetical protein
MFCQEQIVTERGAKPYFVMARLVRATQVKPGALSE